jgi:hypothetical protein
MALALAAALFIRTVVAGDIGKTLNLLLPTNHE